MIENEIFVSVIIPTYNRVDIISRSIDSVLKQSFINFEIIIVDDRSTDNTKDVIKKYMDRDRRIRYICNIGQKGPAGARNSGIKAAKGNYVAFLDSDDEWEDYHLERAIKLMKQTDLNVSFSFWNEKHNINIINLVDSEEIIDKMTEARKCGCIVDCKDYFYTLPSFIQYSIVNLFYCFHINTLVFNIDIISKVGYFEENLFTSEDIDFVLRILDNFNVVIDKNAHFTYYDDTNNSLYSYIDRDNAEIKDLIKNREYVKRLTLDGVNKIEMRKRMKKLIFNSQNFTEKNKCISLIDKRIQNKYYTLAYLNQRTPKAIVFALKLIKSNYNLSCIKFLISVIFNAKECSDYVFDLS